MEKENYLWLAIIFLGLIWLTKRYRHYFRSVLLAFRLKGPKALPVFGNILLLKDSDSLLDIARNLTKHPGTIQRAWVFFLPIILVYEPEHLKLILGNTKVSEKNFFYTVLHTFVGDGLITSTGSLWRKHRKCIQPMFHINFLEHYVDSFAEASQKALQSMSGKKRVPITRIINTCVLNILHKTVLGINLESEDDSPFRRGEVLIIKRLLKPWLLLDSVFQHSEMSKNESRQVNDLQQYVKKVLQARLAERKNKIIPNTCLLDKLIELSESEDFSEEEMVNEAVTFMLAGQDSVGAAIAFCFYYLAKHQDIQDKVYKEINEIFYGDPLTNIRVAHLNQMHYLEQCIKETIRLLPSIPLVARILTSDVNLGKYTIPCGTNIFVSPYVTHRLPHIFPDPLTFNPDRFSPENAKKIHQFGYIPFSIGPRNCIGFKFAYLEMKTVIASMLKNYHISLPEGAKDISLYYRITLRAKGGIWLDIRSRNETFYVD